MLFYFFEYHGLEVLPISTISCYFLFYVLAIHATSIKKHAAFAYCQLYYFERFTFVLEGLANLSFHNSFLLFRAGRHARRFNICIAIIGSQITAHGSQLIAITFCHFQVHIFSCQATDIRLYILRVERSCVLLSCPTQSHH